MKILLVHNRYKFRGGEDSVFETEAALLRENGHEVAEYTRDNSEIDSFSLPGKIALLWKTTWSASSYIRIEELIEKEKPDIAHFHNTMPLITPSAYYACAKAGVPVVQTIHNYRLICPMALLLRNGTVCEECLTSGLSSSIKYGCYRNSRLQTLAVVRMIRKHREMGTWRKVVDAYIALSEFSKSKLVEGGLQGEKIHIKPNFTGSVSKSSVPGDYAVYIGRLSEEKGIRPLLKAWKHMNGFRLKIIGGGPWRAELEKEFGGVSGVEFAGELDHAEALLELAGCRFLVAPSICYENFPMALAEAFACGKPVIASRMGALEEIVGDGETGLHFTPGDPEDLAAKAQQLAENTAAAERMGLAARKVYEARYSPQINYKQLMEIYESVIK